MHAWFLQGEPRGDCDALGCLLRQWVNRTDKSGWSVDCLCWTPLVATLVQERRPDVLLIADASCPLGPWLEEILSQGVGLVVAVSLERAEPYLALAEQYVVHLTPLPATVADIDLALRSIAANLRRQRSWQTRIEQLQQRLDDRILIERAKGILVERLAISEKEAYQRLRLQSRRQRRPMRDIAQCLLDAQSLFSAEMSRNGELAKRNGSAVMERSNEEA